MHHDHNEPTADLPASSGDQNAGAQPTFSDAPTVDSLREGPGSRIGTYKLLQVIGEGGFGSVFLAEQESPVIRKVALKIIKLGMDTRQVVARFEQERQALAVMDHPNIAKVLDAGATQSGRPYFVMELVKGDPIVEYCDKNSLSIRERLELFAQVCNAVQHAHTKGIIHRDIKPSNVMVCTLDGKPSTKVIDFGIAKATNAKLTEKTLFTEHRQLIGTPEYMSPEQAEGSLDIDTRTDVYSLGVLLYELLTGSTPFSSKQLRSAAYAEIQRIIREVDPPKPSTRLSDVTGTLANVAARRHTEPRKLGMIIRGELDWIVMKAIEKDRQRRYETANGLGMDIRRYLAGEAVVAAPPGAAYRFSKFVKRHRAFVSAGSAVATALLIGVVAFAWQARVAGQQRDLAVLAQQAADEQRDRAVKAEAQSKARADELAQVSEFQSTMLSQIDAADAGEKLIADIRDRFGKAMEKDGVPPDQRATRTASFAKELEQVNATDAAVAMIDRTILQPSIKAINQKFKEQPAVDASLRHTLANLYMFLGMYPEAMTLQRLAVGTRRRVLGDDHPDTLLSQSQMADLLYFTAKIDEAIALQRDTLERCMRVLGPHHRDTLNVMGSLGNLLQGQGKFAEAEPLLRSTLEGRRKVLGSESRDTLAALNVYGLLLMMQGKPTQAEPYWREAYETGKRVLGPTDPDTLVWTANMGGLLSDLGRLDDAAKLYNEAAEGFRRVRGEEHPNTLGCMNSLALTLTRQGKLDEAERIVFRVLEAQRRTLGPEHPSTMHTMASLGTNQNMQGKLDEADATLRTALAIRRRTLGDAHVNTLDSMGSLADNLLLQERYAEADALLLERLNSGERAFGKDHFSAINACISYASSLVDQGHADLAEPYARRALDARRRNGKPGSLEVGQALNVLGIVLGESERLEESEVALREAVEIYRAGTTLDSVRRYSVMANLAEELRKRGKLDEAFVLCREVIDGLRQCSRKDLREISHGQLIMGRIARDQKRFADAEIELMQAHQTSAAAVGGGPRMRRLSAEALAENYAAWHAAQPGGGYDAKAAEWKAKAQSVKGPAATP